MATCIQCDNESIEGSDFCVQCEDKALRGIGGWLYLPALSLIVAVVMNGINAVQVLCITMVNYSSIDSITKGVVIVELIGNVLMFLFSIYVASLFLRKMRELPRCYILLLISAFVFYALDAYLADEFLYIPIDHDDIKNLISKLLGCLIWIPYFCSSTRVKRTFIH